MIKKEGWEADWEKIVKLAQKERTLRVLGFVPNSDKIRAAFEQKYGIQADWITARGGEIVQKLLTERRAGLYTADIVIVGTSTVVSNLKPSGAADPLEPALILPEVLDSKAWYGGKLPWIDAQKTTMAMLNSPFPTILSNTRIVGPGEVKGYRDLLNPRWKGKIVMDDPTVPGAGNSTFRHVGWLILNLDYWREFVKQEPVISRDVRIEVEWVTQGKYPINIAPNGPVVTDFLNAGASIGYIQPEEGVYLTASAGDLVLVNQAAHPNAAKVFINWVLSREGARVFSFNYGSQSSREDISTEGIPADRIRQPGVKYFTAGLTEEWELKGPEQSKYARDIFAPLLK